jgi:hypothetical protein
VNRLGPVCLLLALLTGCAVSKPQAPAEEPNPFALPAGAPRNARVGFVQGYPLRSTSVPLLLIPGTLVREGLQVIARDPQLNPSAILEITSVRGRLAVARIVRGQPQPKDEVVLPDPELAEQARSLTP